MHLTNLEGSTSWGYICLQPPPPGISPIYNTRHHASKWSTFFTPIGKKASSIAHFSGCSDVGQGQNSAELWSPLLSTLVAWGVTQASHNSVSSSSPSRPHCLHLPRGNASAFVCLLPAQCITVQSNSDNTSSQLATCPSGYLKLKLCSNCREWWSVISGWTSVRP